MTAGDFYLGVVIVVVALFLTRRRYESPTDKYTRQRQARQAIEALGEIADQLRLITNELFSRRR